jgi:hypothetical protein
MLDPMLDFLSRRVFGPDRLRLLHDELAGATASDWEQHAAEAERLQEELGKLDRSLRMQALRLEEHADPSHPVVALASERIVELTARKAAVNGALDVRKTKRPAGHDPDEVLAMLDAVPDLRPALATATEEKLAAIFQAFDVEITYHRDQKTLQLAATITPELIPDFDPDENDRPEGRSQINGIAGAGFEPATFGL